MMRAKKFICALAVTGLLGMPTISAAGGEAADAATATFEGTVIERTLGQGPSQTIVVIEGTEIRLILHASAGMELHLHGYDLIGTAEGDTPVVMTFRADHAGRFPIEAHGDHGVLGHGERALAYIEVRPE